MIRLGFYIGLILIFSGVIAQKKKSVKLYEKAELELRTRNFDEAIEILKKIIKKDPEYGDPYLRLAVTYSFLRETDSTRAYYNRYSSVVPPEKISSALWLTIANINFTSGAYEIAKEAVSHVKEGELDPNQSKYHELLRANINFSLEAVKTKRTIEIIRLPDEINRFDLQYFPVLTVDNQIMIYTSQARDEDLVISRKYGDKWMPAVSISDKINSDYNEGASTISADGRTLIFTACDGRATLGSCDLFISYREGNNWSEPENLGPVVNSASWESQPALSADGHTLYFASNRPGGQGNRDIWVTYLKGLEWSKPINLGPKINTPYDDITPFIHANDQSLFFTSKGHPGLGGHDIYVSTRDGFDWSQPVNIGYPINSYKDEVGLFITADGRTAYFSKEISVAGRITRSDIMKFEMEKDTLVESASSYITGRVLNADNMRPIQASFIMEDLNDSTIRYQVTSDSVNGKYYLVLTQGHEYGVFVTKEDYLFEDLSFLAPSNSVLSPDTVDILLTPIKKGASIVLENVYFDFNDYSLDQRSLSELDQISKFLRKHPKLAVRIEGYTDSVGSSTYNLELSTKRAKTVYDYLVDRGISNDRISYEGYGAENPIADNNTEEGQKQNRRIEFRILETH